MPSRMTGPRGQARRPRPDAGVRVSITDVAREAGVAISTVSGALNGRAGVSEATRVRITGIAERLGWVPSIRGRSLVARQAWAVGLLVQRPASVLEADPFFAGFIGGVETVLDEAHYALLLQLAGSRERVLQRLPLWARSETVDGIFLTDVQADDPRFEVVGRLGLPAVAINSGDSRPFVSTVHQQHLPGLRALLRHLLDLGHTRIAHVAGSPGFVHSGEREDAWRTELADAGVVAGPLVGGDFTSEGGARAADELLGSADPPTAVLCANDLTAIGFSCPASLRRRSPRCRPRRTTRTPDGRLLLFPRVVAHGNFSRIAVADVVIGDGTPIGVQRRGIALAPERSWERGSDHGGVEDPRLTWVPELGLYLMPYVAYGPLGPRAALAVSTDLAEFTRLGPFQFRYEDALDTDLNLFPNKDLAFFPEPVTGPDGTPCLAFLHRPMFELPGQRTQLPAGIDDPRAAIWLSYVRLADAVTDPEALLRPFGHREIARSEAAWEHLKIGGGPPPIRVPEGWLLLYHGVSGSISDDPFTPQKDVHYAAGGLILDADDPSLVLSRTPLPLLSAETADERVGIVANVVFPTAIAEVEGTLFTFYGMADEAIGVARIERDQR